jgi:multiple sugar transport system permease protein
VAHTIVLHLQDYGSIRYEMGYASAIATLLFIIMIVSNKAIQKLVSKVGT